MGAYVEPTGAFAFGELTVRNVPTGVYDPWGADWFRYWLRRVAESHGA
jgi:proline dehydrogenase